MIRAVTGIVAFCCLILAPELYANQEIWQDGGVSARAGQTGRQFTADETALRALLYQAPHEDLGDRSHEIQLPMPDGTLARFAVVESPIMAPDIAAQYPASKTFKVFGIDDPSASGRVDITPRGFHAMLLTASGRLFIDPGGTRGSRPAYHSRYRQRQASSGFSCGVHEHDMDHPLSVDFSARSAARIPGSLREYRLAVAATEEYVAAVAGAGDAAGAFTEIMTAIARVNVFYERDLGIRLVLVSNDSLLEDDGNVSFSNNDAFSMLNENQTWIDTRIGTANYDIGHVFSTGGGGLAQIGSVCAAADKAKGVTGLPNPTGDSFYIDYVAHEIGHQFSADHSFNGTTASCSGINRNGPTAREPGSGSTIMAYAGICGVEDLQSNSDATFHAGSIEQIFNFTTNPATGGACDSPVVIAPANADPVITPIADRNIPINTPFALTASATDAQVVSYQWDQMDTGAATDAVSFGTDLGTNPLFRSYDPRASGSRDFPALGTQVQGLFDDAEVLPQQARTVSMRVTVRDDLSGQATEDVSLSVIGGTGPFRVTSQTTASTVLFSDTNFFVNWDVAGTSSAPISCASVAIELLAFDDASYTNYSEHTLVGSTANDGSAIVPAPSEWLESPARGRIRVRCIGNYFYALSPADIFFTGSLPRTDFNVVNNATVFNDGGTTGASPPGSATSSGNLPAFASGGGGGVSGLLWLLMAGLGVAGRGLRRQI